MSLMMCIVPVSPLRMEAAHRSEQVSQLLFGEVAEVLETGKDFVKVRVLQDNYEGWCQAAQLEEITSSQAAAIPKMLAANWRNEVVINGQTMHIPFGASLGILGDGSATIGKYDISYKGETIEPANTEMTEQLIKNYAFLYLNSSYQWGGRSVFGVDCSGLTQMVAACLNIALPRDAWQQATHGTAIGFVQEARCGDLAFFDNEAGKITHTGILLSAGSIIHASAKVRVDAIDNFGIINSETGKRTHNLRVITRIH